MLLIKMDENNTFEWKVNHDADKNILYSDEFTFSGYRFNLSYLPLHFYRYGPQQLSGVRELCFYSEEEPRFPHFPYTISISDREGQDIICTKGKIMLEDEFEWPLMILDYENLRGRNIIDNNSFTVRFTINRELDTRERPSISKAEASNVADSTTNTIPPVTKDNSTNTDEGDTRLLETLSNDFSTFYENKTDTDCVLKVTDDQFKVHRAVLSARSSVFSAMFHHDTAENRTGEVNIPDVKATALSDVLYYIYSGKIRGLTADTAASMYTVADKYDLPELRTKCFEFLKCNLTMDNFCELALLAHTHGEMELEERVVWFIEEKLDEVLESSTWQQFLKDKTLLASKLLTSGFMATKKKQSRDTI